MKLVTVYYHFEFSDTIEAVLDRHEVGVFVRQPRVEGKDRDGRHYGSKVHPGNSSLVQALLADGNLEALLDDLRRFKEAEDSHRHLTAFVLPVEMLLE